MSYRHRERDEFDVIKWIILAAIVIAIIAGLIEFNARRNAAALTREMLRPATAEEQRQIDASLANMTAEADKQAEADLKSVWGQATPPQQRRSRFDDRPLSDGERCLDHQRFQRLPNGWAQIGSC